MLDRPRRPEAVDRVRAPPEVRKVVREIRARLDRQRPSNAANAGPAENMCSRTATADPTTTGATAAVSVGGRTARIHVRIGPGRPCIGIVTAGAGTC